MLLSLASCRGALPAADSQAMASIRASVTLHVQCGLPLRAWRLLNQWRMVTPVRNTSAAMIQLYSVANAKG